jgi:protein gp37
MGQDSKIEWTTHTFNPWRGCTKVSPGCTNCYAEKLSHRNPGVLGIWGDKGTRVVASDATWREPWKWDRVAGNAGRRDRVFCASLADVFEDRPELVEPRARLWQTILYTPNLDWLLLTKRPEKVIPALRQVHSHQRERLLNDDCLAAWIDGTHPPDNVWLGTSVENQTAADERIPHLLKVPATVRFLSVEPLLGPVDLRTIRVGEDSLARPLAGRTVAEQYGFQVDGPRIDWVIVGGESGHGARPMHPDWVRSIRDQCQAAGVKFFMKQWGEWLPDDQKIPHWESVIQGKAIARLDRAGRDLAGMWGLHDESDLIVRRVGKKAAGRMLDGRTWDQLPNLVGAAS